MPRSTMLLVLLVVAGLLVLAAASLATWFARRMQRQARFAKYKQRWLAIQRDCAKSDMWPLVVLHADTLVDDALKAAGYRGRTMGERLVSAQHTLSDNDGVWFAHKLRNKIAHEEMSRLYKKDVQAALRGMRQALHDLGVL